MTNLRSCLMTLMLAIVFLSLIHSVRRHNPTLASKRAPASNAKIWRSEPTFFDDFNGATDAKPGEENCYSLNRPLYCLSDWNGHGPCNGYPDSPLYRGQLRDINRCAWAVSDHPDGKLNDFRPENVEISNGIATLRIKAHPENAANPDCRDLTPGVWGGPWTRNCKFSGAAIESGPRMDYNLNHPGAAAKFGKFEIRAKLGNQPGAYPAFWLMPLTGTWPDAGEIDMLESFNGKYWRFDCTYHTGPGHTVIRAALESKKDFGLPQDDFVNNWHVWSVEWTPHSVRMAIDDKMCNSFTSENSQGGWMPAHTPFWWIIGTSTAEKDRNGNSPNPNDNYSKYSDLKIDWVKNYSACEANDDFCDPRDTYDGEAGKEACVVGKLPKTKTPVEFTVSSNRITYLPLADNTCPYSESKKQDPRIINGVLQCVYLERESEYGLYRNGQNIYASPRCRDYRNLYSEYLVKDSEDSKNHCDFVEHPYPNPFKAQVETLKIKYGVTRNSSVTFEVFDVLGRLVYVDEPHLVEKGEYELAWDGRINGGNSPASALYILRLRCTDVETQKTFWSPRDNNKKVEMFR